MPLLYWTAAAQALAISTSKDQADMIAQLPEVEALIDRVKELDPGFGQGALPEFAAETRRMLVRCDEAALADQVDELWIYDRCRCGMEECATVYTAAETVPGPGQRGVGGGFEDTGYVLIDVADDRIVCIETLFYPEFVKALTELLP